MQAASLWFDGVEPCGEHNGVFMGVFHVSPLKVAASLPRPVNPGFFPSSGLVSMKGECEVRRLPSEPVIDSSGFRKRDEGCVNLAVF